MGNSASSANPPPPPRLPPPPPPPPPVIPQPSSSRTSSSSPSPGNPHSSMREKKRSLELPDLYPLSLTAANSANRGRQTKTASIPIPVTPQNPFNHYELAQEIQPKERPKNVFPSVSDFADDIPAPEPYQQHIHPPSTHQPFPPPARRQIPTYRVDNRVPGERSSRGRQQQQQQQQQHQDQVTSRQQQQLIRIQEAYERSQSQAQPIAPPSSPAGPGILSMPGDGQPQRAPFVRDTVRSSIPMGLRLEESEDISLKPPTEDLLADPVEVKIYWRGGGKQVLLARAGDDEWKGRKLMQRDPTDPNLWTLSVLLQPGTHHVRFWVDNYWRVADDLPAAVDDQGSLSNYVAIPLTYGLPGTPQPFNIIQVPPPSAPRKPASGPSFWSADSSADGDDDPPAKPTPISASVKSKGKAPDKHATAVAAYNQAKWTDILPPELIIAAQEEEAYLAASAGQYDSLTGNTRTTGFVPAPNIPPAPGLPRHLEKLILNTRVGTQKGDGNGGGGGGVGSSGIGSGQGGSSARRERRERERSERDRERGPRSSRRAHIPPPPPPSETGDNEPPYIPTPPLPSQPPSSGLTPAMPLPSNISPASNSGPDIGSSSGGTISASGSGGLDSAGTITATTSPQVSLPATPTGPLSPMQTPPKISWASGTGPVPASVLAATMSPGILLAQAQANEARAASASTSASTGLSAHLQPISADRAPISGSRTITLDDGDNMPTLTDDNSVLPVPSHVVLHHLCTSAIRNGVLAVASTTRYKEKYLTTVFYKPS